METNKSSDEINFEDPLEVLADNTVLLQLHVKEEPLQLPENDETAETAATDPLVETDVTCIKKLRKRKQIQLLSQDDTEPEDDEVDGKATANTKKKQKRMKREKRFHIDEAHNVLRLEKRSYLRNSTRSEEQRSYQAEWARRQRRTETAEEREKRCLKQRIAAMKRRLLEQLTMTPEEIMARNAENANKKREKRIKDLGQETEDIKRQRCEKLLYRARRSKLIETTEEKMARRQRQRMYRSRRKMEETAEEAAERRKRNRLYHSQYRKRNEPLVKQPRKRRTSKKQKQEEVKQLHALNLKKTTATEEQQQQQQQQQNMLLIADILAQQVKVESMSHNNFVPPF